MTASSFNINEISVQSPCTVPWSSMTGDDRSRFCKLCKLNVHNIEAMTRTEAETLLGGATGRVCVRFFRRADGTVMTKDCGPVRAARERRIFAYSIAALVLMFVQAMNWMAKHSIWGEKFAAHQSLERSKSSFVNRGIPGVDKAVNWAQQQVEQPEAMTMGKWAASYEMGDYSGPQP